MRAIWGAVTEISDLGVVAEECPHCERPMPCLLRSACRGDYILFMRMNEPFRESSCLCTGCHKAFSCVHYWRYAAVLTIREAKGLAVEELLTRTNPVLAERLQFKEQVQSLGGDARFALGYADLEAMRPGALRSQLLRQLLGWDGLNEEQRDALAQQIRTRTRAWQFARHIAPGFPRSVGCLILAAAAVIVGGVFAAVPAVRSWLWGTVAVVAGLIATAAINHLLLTRRVQQWTRKVLIPEAEEARADLGCFVAVVEDIPASRLGLTEDLWPIRDQLDTICAVLRREGRFR